MRNPRDDNKPKLTPTVQMDEWMSPAEVARALGVSTARIRQLSLAGRLPFQQTPMGRIYPRADIERLAAERQERGLPPGGDEK